MTHMTVKNLGYLAKNQCQLNISMFGPILGFRYASRFALLKNET